MLKEFNQKFYDISHLIQKEFDRNVKKYGDKIQCRKGCSQCCSQIFNITLLDASIISEHISTLSSERQNELKQKAIDYLEKKESVKLNNSGEFSLKPKIPCPALGNEGECTIYEARPVICRRFGIPIYDYKNPEKIYACELNFREGEEIFDDELIPNQTAIGMKWDELKKEFNELQNDKRKFTTIAETIINA
ncbi:MAG: YkgJ family cysteine cluster protein [Ignavibacteria bacterium]